MRIDLEPKVRAFAVTLRPVVEADAEFLFSLYASTRADEMALVDWDAAQKDAFLRMQFTAQTAHYARFFPRAVHEVLLLDDHPVGRVYVDTNDEEIRLLDITLRPEHRNLGIGTALMRDLMDQAELERKPIRFYVWESNLAAQRWYRRLGCLVTDKRDIYIAMEWHPPRISEGRELT